MRFSTKGTKLAVETALQGNSVFHLGGGFHHAFADHGEGFCIYADVAIALTLARRKGTLGLADDVLIIDLDAHRGNGVEEILKADKCVHFFDIYNFQIYPGYADIENPYISPVPATVNGEFYLKFLREELPGFLASVPKPKLAIYNAGTDIVAGDRLGQLNVSDRDVIKRDRFVLDSISALGVPVVVLTSGGYTKRSAGLIAESLAYFLRG
jgi:histone deacetylase 11